MTLETNTADLPLVEQCCAVSRKLLAQYNWQLVTVARLTEQVVLQAHALEEPSDKTLRAIALNCYSLALHQAVLCAHDDALCRQAFEDIHRYLYAIALYRWHAEALAEELAQDALVRIWEQRRLCYEPGAFLQFCLTRLLHAYTYEQRAGTRNQTQALPETREGEEAHHEMVDATLQPPEEAAICQELWEQWLTRFAELRSTRAERQLDMIYYKYFVGFSDEEILERAEPTSNLNTIQALRSKGVRRLKTDEQLYTLTLQLLEACW